MNSSIIRYILGNVMRMEACFLLLPCIVSLVYGKAWDFIILEQPLCALLLVW